MNAFQFINAVRRSGGLIEVENGYVNIRAFPAEVEIALMNREHVRQALLTPGRWPCREFQSHPTTPTLPCRTCGEAWSKHPPDLRRPYGITNRPPLLTAAIGIVAAAAADNVAASLKR